MGDIPKGFPKTLVVDDFASMRRLASAVLREMGCKSLEEAENGRAALDKLRGGGFGLVVSDWNMPVMDGLELLRAIKADPDMAGIKVVMLTAEGLRENVIEAAKAGAAGYVVKPFTPATFADRVSRVVLG